MTFTPACRHCLNWRDRGTARGECWEPTHMHGGFPVSRHPSQVCEQFVDKLVNRAAFEATKAETTHD